jgi:hypothetical protein
MEGKRSAKLFRCVWTGCAALSVAPGSPEWEETEIPNPTTAVRVRQKIKRIDLRMEGWREGNNFFIMLLSNGSQGALAAWKLANRPGVYSLTPSLVMSGDTFLRQLAGITMKRYRISKELCSRLMFAV